MELNHKMGITINGVAIPDPSSWNYQVSALDTVGKRDMTGLLHRNMVATKVNYEFEWNLLGWSDLQTILAACAPEKLTLVAPDPRTFNTPYTGNYYVGDRTGETKFYYDDHEEVAVFSLKLKLIEY